MNAKPTAKPSQLAEAVERSEEPDRTDWELLRSMSDEEAEVRAAADRDAPPTDAAFWRSAKVSFPVGKAKISLYLDEDVLTWFKKQGKGYQTRLNAVLKAYVEAQKAALAHG
jgi:uncharacterized protein (DUF4415 family)